MIDVTSPDCLSLTEAAKLLPTGRNGAHPHLSTLLAWIKTGTPALDGSRVRLEAVRLGGKWITSKQALQRFAAALTAARDFKQHPPQDSP